jgi:hypothetical protein
MTYAEIRKVTPGYDTTPYDLSIELAKMVNAGTLNYRDELFITQWPVYCSGPFPKHYKQPKRMK